MEGVLLPRSRRPVSDGPALRKRGETNDPAGSTFQEAISIWRSISLKKFSSKNEHYLGSNEGVLFLTKKKEGPIA